MGSRIDVMPVFRPAGNATQLQAAISVSHGGESATFENLFLAEIRVQNKGNRDLDELSFGATLGDGDRCIFVDAAPPDRHHVVSQPAAATPLAPLRNVDFALKPFNRGDTYSFRLYVVIPNTRAEPAEIELGSASPIQFVKMPTRAEVLARLASEMALDLGPIRVELHR